MTSELWTGIISNNTRALGQVTLLLPLGCLLWREALLLVLRVPDADVNDSLLEMPFSMIIYFYLAWCWAALL